MSPKPAPRLMTPEQERTAARMYAVARLSIYSIGQRLGIPPETVRASLVRQGVVMRTGAAAQRQNLGGEART